MEAHEAVTTVTPEPSGIPRAMVLTGYFVLSPAIGLFVTVAGAMRKHRRQLDASIEASGPHDFAVRNWRSRQQHRSRPSHPATTFVTIAKRPSKRDGTESQ